MRNRRLLIFGLVFLMMGILFLIGTSLEFDHRATSGVKYAQTHPEEWHLIPEPSTFEEGAGLTGIISVGVGLAFLIVTAMQSLRRQTL
jgi:hypothetical protein